MGDEAQAQTNGLVYTSEDEYDEIWKSLGPRAVTLPSGATFVLRKPQIMKMMRRGQIPNPLMQIVSNVFAERDQRDLAAEAEAKGITVEELTEQIATEAAKEALKPPEAADSDEATPFGFMDVMVWASIVKPRVEMEPPLNEFTSKTASGAVSYDSIPDGDIQFIIAWTNEETAAAARFPGDTGRAPSGGDGREVRAAPERPARDPA